MRSPRRCSNSLDGIVNNHPDVFDEVIASDDEVDDHYIEIERRILDVLSLQAPVASDLRFITALLHVSLHLERVADMSVNIAKIGSLIAHLPRNDAVVTTIREMGGIALKMIDASMDAFANRDLELCLQPAHHGRSGGPVEPRDHPGDPAYVQRHAPARMGNADARNIPSGRTCRRPHSGHRRADCVPDHR